MLVLFSLPKSFPDLCSISVISKVLLHVKKVNHLLFLQKSWESKSGFEGYSSPWSSGIRLKSSSEYAGINQYLLSIPNTYEDINSQKEFTKHDKSRRNLTSYQNKKLLVESSSFDRGRMAISDLFSSHMPVHKVNTHERKLKQCDDAPQARDWKRKETEHIPL